MLDIDDKEENLLDDYDFKKNQKDYEDEELEIEKLKMAFEIEKSSLKKEENLDEMSIIYRIKKNKNFQKVKLFGYKFVKENKKNCKLKVEGKEKELSNYILIIMKIKILY